MTARPIDPEIWWRPASAVIALVLVMVAVLLAAGCVSHLQRDNLCGGMYEVIELDGSEKPSDNVVHLTEQDFKENPDIDAVIRGVKRTNATCGDDNLIYGHCIGESNYGCGDTVRLQKYLIGNEMGNFKDLKFLEYDGKYYYMRITSVS